MNLADIIKNITGGRANKRTVAQLRADLAAIDLEALERKVNEVEHRRRDLLLAGTDDQLRAITEELSQANLTAERGQAAVDELTRLLAEAVAREAVAAVEERASEGRAAREQLIALYSDADSHAAALAEISAKIVAAREVIRDANRATLDAGRRDLKVTDPIGDIAVLVGAASVDALPNPTTWSLSPYWPPRDYSGLPVGNPRHLARARELQAVPARKAA